MTHHPDSRTLTLTLPLTLHSASSSSRTKRVTVPTCAISRVIGRGGSNVNAIRDLSGAHVEIEKKSKGQADRVITIKYANGLGLDNNNILTLLLGA